MFDELEHLLESEDLVQLLDHYAQLAALDRLTWQDRRAEMDGVDPKRLSRLHGELIAFGWIEMNLDASNARKGVVAANCYRVTAAGLRALKHARREGQANTESSDEQPVEIASDR